MVNNAAGWMAFVFDSPWLLAQGAATTPPDPSVAKVKMLAALAGLVILGFGAIFLILLAGRMTRRYMHGIDVSSDKQSKFGPDTPPKSRGPQ